MSITDKISGRVKQAAGDLTGNPALRREGLEEERKGEAKSEQARAEAYADRKAAEVESLERKTNPEALEESATKDELYDRAQALGIQGRADMTKEELAEAIRRRE
ncbi:MAG: hypothetical protein QOE08_1769 [Thermoleophilaceae bacterium]|jgi:uncharacterized protein YjbJ (UPF0337 family)|nr:hypothetical protein [Thermoleophilaceae bacterium]